TGGLGTRLSAATNCEGLASLSFPNTTITTAERVAAGAFQPPGGAGRAGRGGDPFKDLPAFCRVTATVKRAGDTDVKIEVWMPSQGWNGDFQPAASRFVCGAID